MPTAVGVAPPHVFQAVVPLTYLLHDEFTTDEAAPITSPRDAEPGPGTWTLADPDNRISISSGALVFVAGGAGTFNTYLKEQALAHVAGRAFLAERSDDTAVRIDAVFGPGATPLTTPRWEIAGGAISVRTISGSIITVSTAVSPGKYWIIRRAGGGAFFLRDNTLLWVDDGNNTADWIAYLAASTTSSAGQFDYAKVTDLPDPWATAYAYATDRVAGTVSEGETFTHEADLWMNFTFDALPVGDIVRVNFREQDASNYWYVRIESTGALKLVEVVSGTPTTRINAAGVLSGGERIAVIADDETIDLFYDDTKAGSYASAANFKTETAGQLFDTGGVTVSDLVTYPRTASGAALAALERV